MSTFLYKLGRSAYLHRWRFIAAWILILVGMGTAAATLSQPTSSSFTIPGLQSVETQERLSERFPDAENGVEAPQGTIVVQSPEGQRLDSPAMMADVTALTDALQKAPGVADPESIVNPVLAAKGMSAQLTQAKKAQGVPAEVIKEDLAALSPLSEDGRTGTITVSYAADTATDVPTEDLDALKSIIDEHEGDLTIAYSGNIFQPTSVEGTAELIGLAVAAVVLIVTFGSLVAAGMPLITAVVGVAIGLLGIQAMTHFTDTINDTTPTLASMIGLAVGIDYALFILSRFRSELINHVDGHELSPRDLAERFRATTRTERAHLAGLAVGKAGSAVVFAGTTVLIALAALSVINIPFITAMALAAAATVLIAVLVAVSLLPAILGLIGTKMFSGRAPGVKAPDPESETPTMGLRWVRQVRKHPVLALVASAVALVILALPATQLRLVMPSDGMSNPGSPQRTAYEMTSEAFGPGRNAPMVALVEVDDVPPQQRREALGSAVTALKETPGVANAQVVANTGDGSAAQVLITPEYGSTDERAAGVLADLRDREAGVEEASGARYAITGVTPISEDISHRLSSVLLPYIGIVVTLAFVLLTVVFRSLWVPFVAALGFGLSIAATFGATVGLWQEGMLGIVSDPQAIISFLPIMLIGIVFGLAMDYQVFLVTRMREGWAHGKTAGNAVANGFKHGARVVTAAALIMISVFAAFMTMDENFIKVMGFALASAVFFDAFIVRMTIVPAAMFLLGERAWALPRWLDRILPKVDVEGEKLTSVSATQAPHGNAAVAKETAEARAEETERTDDVSP